MSCNIERLKRDVVAASQAVDEAKKTLFAAERAYREAVTLPEPIKFNLSQNGGAGGVGHLTDC
ncbi:hypothetical protein [Burkholderia pseudomallei]|uniref:hypothetical protein n=1 Tax=Burkholderia pseudomallei TaxID=28450 RepID=UPI0005314B00|nr:hypothetical protein [Burkholderia pseudomallei]KGS56559.1 hypothetical protein X949_4264 [Burkholderia pseudomallei MSHR5609]KGW20926.1 hypothetical protein Y047_3430 [Burkholderia pseudomallei MSHR3016]